MLKELIQKNPDQRFCQILSNYDFIDGVEDDFYTENEETLKNVTEAMERDK